MERKIKPFVIDGLITYLKIFIRLEKKIAIMIFYLITLIQTL